MKEIKGHKRGEGKGKEGGRKGEGKGKERRREEEGKKKGRRREGEGKGNSIEKVESNFVSNVTSLHPWKNDLNHRPL